MTSPLLPFDPWRAASTDLDDSLDVRLMLAGRLSVATIQVRRDRAELAAVLHQTQQPSAQLPTAARWEDGPSDSE
jgi:hypothetical protein